MGNRDKKSLLYVEKVLLGLTESNLRRASGRVGDRSILGLAVSKARRFLRQGLSDQPTNNRLTVTHRQGVLAITTHQTGRRDAFWPPPAILEEDTGSNANSSAPPATIKLMPMPPSPIRDRLG
jgi:hypothetical protein